METIYPAEEVHIFSDENGMTFGFLVIDSKIDGRACGGIRMAPDLTLDELRGLAHLMTSKFSFLSIGLGGAKAGIIGDPEGNPLHKETLLRRLGQAIAPWLQRRTYLPGVDFGIQQRDVAIILAAAGMPNLPEMQSAERSGEATALTVFAAMSAACDNIGLPLTGAEVGIEGFGSVGSELALLVTTAGAKVVAVSTSRGALWNAEGINISQLIQLRYHYGSACVEEYNNAEFMESPTLATLPLDIYAPCARSYSINDQNASSISAKIICGGSNLQAKPAVENVLHERSIFYVPPYVANCGGVLWGAMQTFGLDFSYFQNVVQTQFQLRVSRLFEEALLQKKPPLAIADDIVARHFQTMKAQAESYTFKRLVWKLGRAANNKGLVPAFVKQRLGQQQVMRSLSD